MAKKPESRWETALHQALRDASATAAQGKDARIECLDLRFQDGHLGRAELSLHTQRIDAQSAARDPELVMAIKAWLLARGQREIALETFEGESLAQGLVAPQDFDDFGAGPPQPGIVTLAPSNYDLAEALGLCDERLLACEDSTTPRDGRVREKLGPDLNPDLARVKALSPGLVLASLSVPGMERVVVGLRRLALPHMVFAPRRLDEIAGDMLRLGAALGLDVSAQQAAFQATREELAAQAQRLRRPVRVYLEWWPRPQFTPGSDCYSNELIELAGGRNVFADQEGSSLQVEAAQIARQDPELAFVSWCGVDLEKLDPTRMAAHPELSELEMLRAQRVYPLDEALSGRPGPRVLLAAQVMATQIQAYAKSQGLLDERPAR